MATYKKLALTRFETETCGRCGGGGRYSWCEMWGDTCFECGYAKGVPGLGRRLTKRGIAAQAYFQASLPKKATKDLQPGDRFWDAATGWRTAVEVKPSATTGSSTVGGVTTQHSYIDVVMNHKVYGKTYLGLLADGTVAIRPTDEQLEALVVAALAYQETLTKAGTPRKRGAKEAK